VLFMTHFRDDGIPLVWHRVNELHRTTALQDFMETPQRHALDKTEAYMDFIHAHPARILESQYQLHSKGAKTTEISLTTNLIFLPRGGYECDDYSLVRVHCKTLYMYSLLNLVHGIPSEGRTSWVRRYCSLMRVLMRNVLPVSPGMYMYAQFI
jgi:hypothetical protein